jgi:phosphopantetheine adenylyltransferase
MSVIARFFNKFLDEHAIKEIKKRHELLRKCVKRIDELKIQVLVLENEIKCRNAEIERLKYILEFQETPCKACSIIESEVTNGIQYRSFI